MKIVIRKDRFAIFILLIKVGEVWLSKVGEMREMAVDGVTQVPPHSHRHHHFDASSLLPLLVPNYIYWPVYAAPIYKDICYNRPHMSHLPTFMPHGVHAHICGPLAPLGWSPIGLIYISLITNHHHRHHHHRGHHPGVLVLQLPALPGRPPGRILAVDGFPDPHNCSYIRISSSERMMIDDDYGGGFHNEDD